MTPAAGRAEQQLCNVTSWLECPHATLSSPPFRTGTSCWMRWAEQGCFFWAGRWWSCLLALPHSSSWPSQTFLNCSTLEPTSQFLQQTLILHPQNFSSPPFFFSFKYTPSTSQLFFLFVFLRRSSECFQSQTKLYRFVGRKSRMEFAIKL